MKFYVFEDGCPEDEQTIEIAPGTRNPRAKAAAMFCASDDADYDGTMPVDIYVCPADDVALALPDWGEGDEDDPRPYVCLLVTPKRVITWSAVQVHGFNEYGKRGVSRGEVDDGERATVKG